MEHYYSLHEVGFQIRDRVPLHKLAVHSHSDSVMTAPPSFRLLGVHVKGKGL